ncbi:hypothetical protein DFH28DRAFT_6278 [Melampsora americana]|nr:hypothetical protein DFH28DRAFT_6278 [Melampsora americana]
MKTNSHQFINLSILIIQTLSLPSIQSSISLSKRQTSLSELPSCGQTCYVSSIGNSGGCSITDFRCLCQSSSFMNSSQQCFQSTCELNDIKTIFNLSQQVCITLNVTLYRIKAFNSTDFSSNLTKSSLDPSTSFFIPNFNSSMSNPSTLNTQNLNTSNSQSIPQSKSQNNMISLYELYQFI